jgi:peroxiredoxin
MKMRSVGVVLLSTASLFAGGGLSGRRAPGFSLLDFRTSQQRDPQDYRGRILLVDLMQTTCPHCAKFSEMLEEVVRKYTGKVAVVSIVIPPDTPATVNTFIAAHKVTVPVLFDCGQVAASYLKATPQHQSFDLPHVFLIDQEGMIRNDFEYGPTDREIFEGRALFAEIDKLLAGGGKAKK